MKLRNVSCDVIRPGRYSPALRKNALDAALYPEDYGSTFLRNVHKFLLYYITPHPKSPCAQPPSKLAQSAFCVPTDASLCTHLCTAEMSVGGKKSLSTRTSSLASTVSSPHDATHSDTISLNVRATVFRQRSILQYLLTTIPHCYHFPLLFLTITNVSYLCRTHVVSFVHAFIHSFIP